MNKKIKDLDENIIILTIAFFLSFSLLIIAINQKKRILKKELFSKNQEHQLLFLIRLIYIIITGWSLINNQKNLTNNFNNNQKQMTNDQKRFLASLLLFIVSFINISINE